MLSGAPSASIEALFDNIRNDSKTRDAFEEHLVYLLLSGTLIIF